MAAPLALPAKGAPSAPSTTLSSSSSPSTPTTPLPSIPEQPPLPPLHLAAQRGDLAYLHSLSLSSDDEADAAVNQPDDQGITPLHWAAINGHLLFAKDLLRRGADVDARGGELEGTPLHWAARGGHLPLVHLLLSHSADPTLRDAQSFNALHLAVHSSSAFLVAYLLFTLQPLAVDTQDSEGHTSLAWAAYQGDAISVELLLLADADPNRPDNAELRPLHWAVTKGNSECIRLLVAAGAELNAREAAGGKTAREMAVELKSLPAYDRGLADAGIDPGTGRPWDVPLSPARTRVAIFAVVAVGMGAVFGTLAYAGVAWYFAVPLVAGECYGLHYLVARVLLGIKSSSGGKHGGHGGKGHSHGAGGGERLTKSPYLCAIIAASLGWVGWVWVTRFLSLPGYFLPNFLFFLSLSTCAYTFYRAITLDPGTVRREEGEGAMKETIESLVESGTFNGMNFCLTCLVRRPLRSKHSYATGRCVARFDHYCPWVWNDIGVNNHRQFLLFVGSLVVGVLWFIYLTWGYFYERAPSLPPSASCPSLVPTPLCEATYYDPFTLLVTLWAALQLSWTAVLLGAQVWQVCRQLTTLEVSNLSRWGYMGGRPGVSGRSQFGYAARFDPSGASSSASQAARHAANLPGGAGDGSPLAFDDPSSLAHAPAPSDSPPPGTASSGRRAKPTGTFAFLLKLLGLDRFVGGSRPKTPSVAGGGQENPFSINVWTNCVDFWTLGRGGLGVRYERLYEVPEGGFGRVVRERRRREREAERREREEGRDGRGVGLLGLRMGGSGANGGGAGGGRKGYERVAMEDVV
ncbi:hypothetical protein JCM8097_006126 [Rhodosporidiobolus ruineniae]